MNNSIAITLKELTGETMDQPAMDSQARESIPLWAGTFLCIAGVPLLIGEGELDEIIETPTATPIPGTKHWVMGVAAHKGGLLPIISGDGLFRQTPYLARPREYCLVVRRPGTYLGITLSAINRDIKFPAKDMAMDEEIDPDFSKFCHGGFHYQGQFLAILDTHTLISDSNFLEASASKSTATKVASDEH